MTELLSAVQIDPQNSDRIEFKSSSFVQEIWRQLPNYHHLLWSIINMIVGFLGENLAKQSPQFRRALGIAIGRLGIYHRQKLFQTLTDLSENGSGTVRVIASYALEGICLAGVEHYSLATTYLEDWLKSMHPYRLWTLSASIERIYPIIALEAKREGDESIVAKESLQLVENIFTQIAGLYNDDKIREYFPSDEDFDGSAVFEDIFNSIVHAVIRLSWNHTDVVVMLLSKWIEGIRQQSIQDEDEQRLIINRFTLAIFASQLLFIIHDGESPLSEELNEPLLSLTGPVLLSSDFDAGQYMMASLKKWTDHQGWGERIPT